MPTVLVSRSFSSGVGAWAGTAPSHSSAEGADFATGLAQVSGDTSGSPGEIVFPSQTAGKVRVDFSIRVTDANSVSGGSYNTSLYLLPTGAAASSANTVATVFISRDTTKSADADFWRLTYRSGASFLDSFVLRRDVWWPLSIVADLDNATYDIYLQSRLVHSGLTFPDATPGDLSRLVISNPSGGEFDIDSVVVTADYSEPTWELLVDDDFTAAAKDGEEVEDLTPDIDNRWSADSSPYKVPDDQTTYGAFTASSTNGLEPDSGKSCLAMLRGTSDGAIETTWTLAASGTRYAGVMFRVWAGVATDSYLLLRYNSAATSGEELSLYQGSTLLDNSDGTAGGVSYAAGTSHTFRVEMRGRYIWCYVDGELQFGGPHAVTSGATGARGQIAEENFGPFTEHVGNYCTSLRHYGPRYNTQQVAIGSRQWDLSPTKIRGMVDGDLSAGSRNLGWSNFVQCAHVSEADGEEAGAVVAKEIDATDVVVAKHRTNCLREDTVLAVDASVWMTFTRRGWWVSDGLQSDTDETNINFTPDHDLRGELWSKSIVTAGSGAATTRDVSGYQGWTTYESGQAACAGQYITAASGAKLRVTAAVFPDSGVSGTQLNNSIKWQGVGDPISVVIGNIAHDQAAMDEGSAFRVVRAYLAETASGLALSGSDATAWRDDVTNPATLNFATGSAKTDAEGDTDADGFNERYGWYEVNASGGSIDLTVVDDAYTRHQPQFRIHGFSPAKQVVSIASASSDRGVDYWLDDLGDGTAVLQLSGNYSSGVRVQLLAVASADAETSYDDYPGDPASSGQTSGRVDYRDGRWYPVG